MSHLIDKSALVAEIERLKADALQKKSQCKRSGLERIMHQIGAYNKILSFLDTLESKEVDLDREMQAFALLYLEPLKISDSNIGISITMAQLYSCAKHFFELGLKARKGE